MAYVLALAFLAFAVYAAWSCWCAIAQTRKSAGWPTVTGTVISSEVIAERSDDSLFYHPKVEYEYQVGGTRHRSGRLYWGPRAATGWRTVPERMVARYPAGAPIVVRYDPHDPAQAVIEPGTTRAIWITAALGTLGVVLAGAVLLLKG